MAYPELETGGRAEIEHDPDCPVLTGHAFECDCPRLSRRRDTNVEHGERWEFNAEVTRVFDDMLSRSIPQYQLMRFLTNQVALRFVKDGHAVVDLGCSRGEAMAPLANTKRGIRFFGYEVSEPMREAARERFKGNPWVEISEVDLRKEYPRRSGPTSLTLCVLTLQFVPINHRQRILSDAYHQTSEGGALILVEKVLGEGAQVDALLVDEYHRLKHQAGYSQEEIERKRLALEGVLVPVTASWNVEMLRRAGFREVDCYWRCLNFAGWVAIR